METDFRYRTLLFAPIVTLEADGRYVASAVITDPTNEELTVDVDGKARIRPRRLRTGVDTNSDVMFALTSDLQTQSTNP